MQTASSTFGVAEIPFLVASPVRHAAVANNEIYVVTHPAIDYQISRVTSTETQVLLRRRPRNVANAPQASDGFVVARDTWWYAALDGIAGTPATTFVKGDGTRATHLSPLKQPVSSYLIVLPGEKPRALEISVTHDATLVRELDWSGPLRSWRMPRIRALWPHMTAESLSDGRIALFSDLEELTLVILSDGGNLETTVLRHAPVEHFDTAIDETGRIAIVAASNDTGTIEKAIMEIDNTSQAEWRTIRRSARVGGRLREIQVLATPRGFVAAWINEALGRRIEATELRAIGRTEPIVDVGQASPRGDAAFFDMQVNNNELVFWWDDGDRLYRRRVPLPLTGFALLEDLAKQFCAATQASEEHQ